MAVPSTSDNPGTAPMRPMPLVAVVAATNSSPRTLLRLLRVTVAHG